MAIKEVLELVGSDVVIKQLSDVKKAGEESLATFNKPLPELKFPTPPDAKPVEEFGGHVLKLKDALHTLRPVMQAAGVQFGEFGAFTRLAAGNVALLATALGGAIIVGLAKIGENAARTKGQLDDAFGKPGVGQQAFTALQKQAKEFGTSVDGLAPGLEAFQVALSAIDRTAKGFVALKAEDLPGAELAKNADAVAKSYDSFIKLLRAGRQTQDEAQKTAKTFFDTFKDGGPLTSAALKALPVGTVAQLQQALGAAGVTAQQFFKVIDNGKVTIDDLQAALLKFAPQAQKAFDEKAIKTFGDEFGKLGVTFTQGLPNITAAASTLATGFVAALRGIVQPFVLTVEGLSQKMLDLVAKARLLAGAEVGPTLEQAGRIAPGAAAPFPLPEDAGKKAGEDVANALINSSGQIIGKAAPQLGDDLAKGINKGFIDNKFTLPAPEINKTQAEKNFDEVLKDLSDKTQEFAAKPLFPEGLGFKLDIVSPLVSATVAAKKVFDEFVDGIKAKWDELSQLKRPDLPIPLPGTGAPRGGGLPLLTATPGLGLLQSLFGGGDQQQAPIPENLTAPFQQADTQIRQIWTALMGFISTSVTTIDLSSATQALVAPFQNAMPLIQQTLLGVAQAVDDLLRKLQAAQSSASQLGAFAQGGRLGGGAPFASGGVVHGPGSTTSDSIMAWLSRGEYVVNARATSVYLPLLQAINGMRLPVGHFNVGGLARVLGNRFAAGGVVSSGGNRSLTLVLNQKSFSLTGSKGTIDDLEREASLRGLAMIGKAPSWIR